MADKSSSLVSSLGGFVAAGAGTYGIQQLLLNRMRNVSKHFPHSDIGELRERVKEQQGLDIGFLHEPKYWKDTASYTSREAALSSVFWGREDIKDRIEQGLVTPRQAKGTLDLLERAESAVGKHGLVISGTYTKKPHILAHEVGHAIAGQRGTPLEKFTSSPAAGTLGTFAGPAGVLAGLAIGGSRYGKGLKGLIRAAGGGAAVGGLLSAPAIYGEHAANRYAMDVLPERLKERTSFAPTIGSYYAGALAPGVIAPLVSRGIKFLGKVAEITDGDSTMDKESKIDLAALAAILGGSIVGAGAAGEGRRLKGALTGGALGLAGGAAGAGIPRLAPKAIKSLMSEELAKRIIASKSNIPTTVGSLLGGLAGGLYHQPEVSRISLGGRLSTDSLYSAGRRAALPVM